MASDFYCDVVAGRVQVEKVRETEHVLAFHHTRPAYSPVHVVVIPKRHVSDLTAPDLDDALLVEVLRVASEIAADVVRRYGAARIITNLGDYQETKHLHVHVVSGDHVP